MGSTKSGEMVLRSVVDQIRRGTCEFPVLNLFLLLLGVKLASHLVLVLLGLLLALGLSLGLRLSLRLTFASDPSHAESPGGGVAVPSLSR